MMKIWRLVPALLGALGLAMTAAACGDEDPIEETEQIADCFRICARYQDCVEDIDLTACTDACEDRIEVDPALADQASACESCLDGKACAEAETAGCFANCPVVPLQD